MFLEKLKLENFRNYSRFCFYPSQRTLILGNNGQGKTNLLESLSLLAYGKSFRVALPCSLVQEGKSQAEVFADIVSEKKHTNLKFLLKTTGEKSFFINNKKALSNEMSQTLPLAVFSPESMTFLKGSAEQRRDWMDACLKSLGQGVKVREFKKALMQKNAFLRELQKDFKPSDKAISYLQSLNEVFKEKSLALITARSKLLKKLGTFYHESYRQIFKDIGLQIKNSNQIKLVYLRSGKKLEQDLETDFNQDLSQVFLKEQKAGLSLLGPHRDDFKINLNGKDARFYCSQGQQRALILALKTAITLFFYRVRHEVCLILLDDIFSEIDNRFLKNLLSFFNSLSSQIIITATKTPDFLDKKKVATFYLEKGVLTCK